MTRWTGHYVAAMQFGKTRLFSKLTFGSCYKFSFAYPTALHVSAFVFLHVAPAHTSLMSKTVFDDLCYTHLHKCRVKLHEFYK
jgi:hypothetical protein